MIQTDRLRKIDDIERDWQASSDFMREHYAIELIQAQRAEIEFLHMKIRELEEELEYNRL